MPLPSKACASALIVALLGGCQALGGGGGVMPESEVGPPPSMRGAVPGARGRAAEVDPDGVPLQTAPTRRLDLPKTAGGVQSRASAADERRIRREDLEGGSDGRSGGGSLAPQMSPSGGVGLGGKF